MCGFVVSSGNIMLGVVSTFVWLVDVDSAFEKSWIAPTVTFFRAECKVCYGADWHDKG